MKSDRLVVAVVPPAKKSAAPLHRQKPARKRVSNRSHLAAMEYELQELRAMAQLYAARRLYGWSDALVRIDAALEELRKELR